MNLFEQAKHKLGSHKAVAETIGVPDRTYFDWRKREGKYRGHKALIEFALKSIVEGPFPMRRINPPPTEHAQTET